MRAESAVESTKSENITVTWRRSAVMSLTGAVTVSMGADGADVGIRVQVRDCVEQDAAMAYRGDTQFLQVLRTRRDAVMSVEADQSWPGTAS